MIPPGDPVLTAAEMRAAEDRAIAEGSSVSELMGRAGAGIADWVYRLAAGAPVLILCGPGNNGGDGYVAARLLAERGLPVRVAALGDPRTPAASEALARWTGPVEPFDADLAPAPILVDALFGTGLSRALDPIVTSTLESLIARASLAIAVDLPSGVATDGGVLLGPTARCSLTLALGALKPAHLLQPAASRCGQVRCVDLGLTHVSSRVETLATPRITPPGPTDHKYTRGMVAIIAGAMHGASELAALAAYRAGAGYVLLFTGGLPQPPHAIVRQRWDKAALADPRIGALVIGPGLGRDDRSRAKLDAALASDHPLVIDGDALHLLDPAQLRARAAPAILTPHAGEFAALFGEGQGSKLDRARAAAQETGTTIVFKGADTIIAGPDGAARILRENSAWLSVAGTGDVLAGAIAALLARRELSPYDAASAGAWLHARGAAMLNRCFLADELADALPLAPAQAHG